MVYDKRNRSNADIQIEHELEILTGADWGKKIGPDARFYETLGKINFRDFFSCQFEIVAYC